MSFHSFISLRSDSENDSFTVPLQQTWETKSKFIIPYNLLNCLFLFCCCCFHSHRSEVKARQDVKPDFRHPPFTDYRQPPVDYRHPPVTDYRQPPTLDYRQPPALLDFRQHPAAAQFPLGIPADFRPQAQSPILVSNRSLGCTRCIGFLASNPQPFCRTMITSRWSWRRARKVSASVFAGAESTRWTCLCCALRRMVLPSVTEE